MTSMLADVQSVRKLKRENHKKGGGTTMGPDNWKEARKKGKEPKEKGQKATRQKSGEKQPE